MDQPHVKLSGDIEGSYVVEESLEDGRLVVAPEWPSKETSAEAILQRAGAERLRPRSSTSISGICPLTARGSGLNVVGAGL